MRVLPAEPAISQRKNHRHAVLLVGRVISRMKNHRHAVLPAEREINKPPGFIKNGCVPGGRNPPGTYKIRENKKGRHAK